MNQSSKHGALLIMGVLVLIVFALVAFLFIQNSNPTTQPPIETPAAALPDYSNPEDRMEALSKLETRSSTTAAVGASKALETNTNDYSGEERVSRLNKLNAKPDAVVE